MTSLDRIPRTRIIRGADCYWAIGTRSIARLPLAAVTGDRELVPEAEQLIRAADLSPIVERDTYQLTVLVTTRCNLACAYCFQNTELPATGQTGIPLRIAGMSIDEDRTGDILEFAKRQLAQNGKKALDVMLFGGEPTMYMDQCLRLLRGAGEIGLARASMISNGTLFTVPQMKALEEAGLRDVQVTFDGDAEAHDRSRITIGGRGTFARILDNLAEVSRKTDIRWQLRVNLTAESIKGADRLVDRLSGRLDPARFGIYFALVHDPGIGFAGTVEHSRAVAEQVADLYGRVGEAGFPLPRPTYSTCATCGETSGRTGATVNADGVLYSCWESAGQKGMEVGDVTRGYLPESVISSRWVACGYTANGQVEPHVRQTFTDTLDALLLDRHYRSGRLGTGKVREADGAAA
ncbi:radical SAM protein [Streptomyces sp. NPDC001595]|uniref:radical SAM protein n=1 Tax=Streptomyces sp. NPDC001532 TaxID=3154520 RepID=UPI003321AC6E